MHRLQAMTLPILLAAAPAAATITFDVNSLADVAGDGTGVCETAAANGVCTLRAAVMAAHVVPRQFGEEVVINVPAGTYTMTIAPSGSFDFTGSKGNLVVYGFTTIVGAGAAVTIIDANHIDRAFSAHTGAKFKVQSVTIRNGQPATGIGQSLYGGGIDTESDCSVTVDSCVIDSCAAGAAASGGGISGGGAVLTVTNSTIQHCTAGYAGGISDYDSSSTAAVTISHSTISTNTALTGAGGGIWAITPVSIDHSAVVYNQAQQDSGGGIAIQVNVGPSSLKVWNSTVAWNAASNYGGGIFAGAPVSLYNVTIVANTVGGISQNPNADGGGIDVSGGTVSMSNSILFNNSNDYARTASNCLGTVTSNGHDIINDVTGCTVVGGYTAADPLIDDLKDNGGGTPTFMIASTSPAKDAVSAATCTDAFGAQLTDDQRGVKRPIGTGCDLGAVEREPPGDVNGDGSVTVTDVFWLINSLFANGPIPLGRANANGDGSVNVLDVFYLINFLYANGQAPIGY